MRRSGTSIFIQLTIIFWGLNTSMVHAQKLDHRLGEWIIQLEEGVQPQTFQKDDHRLLGRAELYHFIPLIPSSNIYKCILDYRKINEIKALETFRKLAGVVHAQFNYLIEWRTTPDDPMYDKQWHWWNTGQLGAPAGVDLKMQEAWDLATGGVTSAGDTIVACIIDAGFDALHEDLAPNHWVNHGEIPGNGIDDDHNGYIDDFRGWNVETNNDHIKGSGTHGTGVAGLAGAKGNNGKGITGINWNVKLMFIAGISDIASVLKAYAYPLRMRQLYNQSGGKSGAFVVVTNASWGIPNLREQDAPLWCAFYDSLGQAGILSCGAAPNRAVDIDQVGDLPSNCTSDYFIGVTNVTPKDEWYDKAGFGLKSVDLGSFGQKTFTTNINNGYREFGGTSAATPIVTGAIALLYARSDCNNLSTLSKRAPDLAALTARHLILDNVKPLSTLERKCTSGGRLDILNALQQTHPFYLLAASDTSVVIDWEGAMDSVRNLEWRKKGDAVWISLGAVRHPFWIDELEGCTQYEIRGLGLCSDDTTGVFTFQTLGCCLAPEPLKILNIDTTFIRLGWPDIYAAKTYQIHLSALLPDDTIRQVLSRVPLDTSSTYVLDNLIPCTMYLLSIQTDCEEDLSSFSDTIFFRTKGCGACLDLDYCTPAVLPDASDDGISQISINNVNLISSGQLTKGYEMVGESSLILPYCLTKQMVITGTSASGELITVWVDFNKNGRFDSSEVVYNTTLPAQSPYSAPLHIPKWAIPGSTRMRIAMKWPGFDNTPPSSCGDNIEFGQVIDICVTIEDNCIISPDTPKVDTPTIQSAIITWKACAPHREYQLGYVLPDSSMHIITTQDTFVLLQSLPKCLDIPALLYQRCKDSNDQTWSSPTPFRLRTKCSTSTTPSPILKHWSLAPNPSKNILYVSYPYDVKSIRAEIINLSGQILKRRSLVPTGTPLALDISHLKSGVYWVKIETGIDTQLLKFTVLH